jgi:aminopeptidase YwaD
MMLKYIRYIVLLSLFLGLSISCTEKQKVDPEITKDELYAHIDFLASDSLQGRQPGTPFDRVAAKYVKDVMEKSGIELLDKNGYQFFEFIYSQDFGEKNSLSVNGLKFEFEKDFTVFPFSKSDTLASTPVFVGYGYSISSDTLFWDDYSGLSVTDKWVLILRGNPYPEKPNTLFEKFSSDRYKAMVAKDQGAAGVILVSSQDFSPKDELFTSKQKSFDLGIPVIHVKRSVANAILIPSGKKVDDLVKVITLNKKPFPFIVGSNVCVRTQVITNKKNTQNVVGMINGTDPVLKNQYIVLGAHYDHIGMGGNNTSSRTPDSLAVHNGADDNASGVAAVLEIAQKLAAVKPKRSIVIIAFAAEEIGLLGSRYFVDSPLVPLDSIVAMINIDMLGRMNKEQNLQIGGVKTSLELENILISNNKSFGFNLSLSPQGYGPSDHASFYSKNIPVLFFSTGPHIDYHTPNDVIEAINFDGLAKSSEYIYSVLEELANMQSKLTFQESGPAEPNSRHGQELKVKFGLMPDVSGATNDGLKVLAVNENQPAAIAGILKNDIITSINGKPVNNIQDYMYRLQELSVGSTVSVEILRNDIKLVVLVQL